MIIEVSISPFFSLTHCLLEKETQFDVQAVMIILQYRAKIHFYGICACVSQHIQEDSVETYGCLLREGDHSGGQRMKPDP